MLLGFIVGGLLLLAKAGLVDNRVWVWLPAHVDILLVGWMIQLAMGMAYWILPRLRFKLNSDTLSRGRTWLAWVAFALLNIGLVVAAVFTLFSYGVPDQIWLRNSFPLGIVLQVVAMVIFAVYAWSRVIPVPVIPPPAPPIKQQI
jgi:hypothetical protein